ncbi:hypothetical protein KAFR_0E04280 [Kazachstania africana CBS 2517]|uniref:FAM86 N-terminal domain-containing protein n=1 Tax=Kazachstania africana (strain ATCC 22294 / BCRC 22015 / CBS 2517 / CECT 1963 / NBRC 1671 / NRRL Y-8276) TaxID=1071382 RepID=H2AW29_KAZAF|nr:hypothetical protein KAFR_0E04280 [Kazachstania africana CBS 2517]CCF58579.1 hypothetical protein KAFR_0E04280 [Kazachstania africana CBS 2517]
MVNGISEVNVYDRLLQRCPVTKLHDGLKSADSEKLRDRLVTILEVNPYYVKQVIRVIIDNNYHNDIEWFYEKYVDLLQYSSMDSKKMDIIRYIFNGEVYVDINERPNLISAMSTTGFRTWEAASYLCDYISNVDTESLNGCSTVLELGAGTGLCSLTLLKGKFQDDLKKVYVTDGDTELISGQLLSNFKLNEMEHEIGQKVKLQRLLWGEDSIPNDIDCVIGADVTYDDTLFDDLFKCLRQCFEIESCKMCLIASTIRNVETDRKFLEHCHDSDFKVEIIQSTELDPQSKARVEQTILNKPLIAPIMIYKIYKEI